MKYSKSLRIISDNILAVNPERFRRALARDRDPQVVSGTQPPKGRRSPLVRAGSESTRRGRLRGALLRAGSPRPAVRGVAAASRCIEPGRPAGRDAPAKCGKSRSGADTSAFRTRNGELRSRWWSEKEAMRRRSCDRRRAVRADRSVINGGRREEAARDVARVAALPEPPSSARVRAENRFSSRAHRAGSFGEAQSCGSWSRVASRVNPS